MTEESKDIVSRKNILRRLVVIMHHAELVEEGIWVEKHGPYNAEPEFIFFVNKEEFPMMEIIDKLEVD